MAVIPGPRLQWGKGAASVSGHLTLGLVCVPILTTECLFASPWSLALDDASVDNISVSAMGTDGVRHD